MKISDFSIKRPVFTFVTMLLVIVLGAVSLLNIPLKLIPDIDPPIGVVVTSYQGTSPEEVLDKVTKPLEENLATLPGLKTMTSTSQEGANLILLEFSWTTNIQDVEQEVIQRIDQTVLPDDADRPRFLKFDPAQIPVIQLALRSGEDQEALKELAEELKQELSKVDGVASVNLSGTSIKEVRVELDQDQLKEYRLSQQEIVDVIKANDISLPGETILTDGKELTTRIISTIDSLDTLKNLTVAVNPANGEEIKLSDVSDVQLVNADERTITRTNQEPSVLLSVLQESDANTASVSDSFLEELDVLLEKEKYKNIESNILFDQGEFIKLSIDNISDTLIQGGILAMIVLFLFLRNLKSPIIIGVAIPYSVIVTFVLIYFSDFTLNILTLGGLALGIGMLVDNSIVVIENIYRHLSMGKDPIEAAKTGTKEVGGAITASTLTTVAVFIPVIFIPGIIGKLFTEFALTVSFSLFASLIVALTVVPMLASKWLKKPKENIEEKRQQSFHMKALERAAKWSLRHRAAVLAIAFVMFAIGMIGIRTVGTEFMPSTDEGYFTAQIKLENGTALSETEKVMEAIEEKLKDEQEVDTFVSLIGTTQEGSFRGSTSGNIGELYVKMKPLDDRNESTFEFVDRIKRDIERAATSVNKSAEVNFRLQSSSGTNPNTLMFSVRDSDPERLNEAVDKIYNALVDLDDVTELTTDLMEEVDEIQMTVDREKALEEGLAPSQIAMIVNDVTRGSLATQMVADNGEIYEVFVEYDKEVTQNLDKLGDLLIKKEDGSYISLDEVVAIETGKGPVNIQRINQQDAVQFTLKYKSSVNLGDISKAVDEEIEELDLSEETDIVFSADRDLMESTLEDLTWALMLAILLIYFVMAAQFESLKHPFVIMFTVPLMVIGVAIGLVLTKTPVGLTTLIGVIILAGIVVNNAIVLVDYINQKKASGMKTYDALIVSVKDRVRPILMTALTTIFGLIPLSLGIGEGAEIMQPMGIAVIGGLVSSTFLTLFVIPVIYSLIDKETRRMNKVYATPDGQLIPAYLLEETVEKEEEKEIINLPEEKPKKYSKEDMAAMLEQLLKLVQDDDQKKNKKEDE